MLGVHGVYVNSSIVDERALIKTRPLQVEGRFIPTRSHKTNSTSLIPSISRVKSS
jgi:hypothetical protein